MTMTLFDDKPAFVSVHAEQFVMDGCSYPALLCLIQKAQPIRKLFERGKLLCYSMDGKVAHARKTYCVFCPDAFRCQRKIRLSLIVVTRTAHIPAILDINHGSFTAFAELVQAVGEDKLNETPVSLRIVYDAKDQRVIEFTPD